MANTPGVGIGFWLRWREIEPVTDPAWGLITKRKREEFRRAAEAKAAAIWDARVAKGKGTDDADLAPLAASTIRYRKSAMGPAIKGAPPLTPARTKSRTRAWLRSRRTEEGVWFYWLRKLAPKQKQPWAVILQYHRLGMVRGAPARDVMDFSPGDLLALKRWAAWWWRMNRGVVVAQSATTRKAPASLTLRIGTPTPPAPGREPFRRRPSTKPTPLPRGLDRLRRRGG